MYCAADDVAEVAGAAEPEEETAVQPAAAIRQRAAASARKQKMLCVVRVMVFTRVNRILLDVGIKNIPARLTGLAPEQGMIKKGKNDSVELLKRDRPTLF